VSVAERLAALAGVAAAVASVAGFVPGLYRDPAFVIGQSHGYDVGNLVVVAVLFVGLLASRGGSLRGRLVAIGALGCLFYSYVTYAFLIVLNPVTPLYIAVLGFGGWSFAIGLAEIPDQDTEAFLTGRPARRVTGAFLVLIALLFGLTWLRQIGGSLLEGQLPTELRAAGWPMNPVWVVDLGFVLPLMALTGIQLLTRARGGAGIAISLLVFMSLLGLSILAMAVSTALGGQPVDPFMPALFVAIVLASTTLAWRALAPERSRAGEGSDPPLGRLAKVAIGLEIFLAVGALGGGAALMVGPNGEIIPLPVSALAGSPFINYFVPGAVLFLVLGLGPLLAAALAWQHHPLAPLFAFATGIALLIWLGVEIAIVGFANDPPLQPIYLTLGALLALVGAVWLWQTRSTAQSPWITEGGRDEDSLGASG
jgi:hypothetical protein